MSATIFLLTPEGRLSPLEESGYTTEDELQVLLAENPDLLAGEQISPDDPVRWLLVSREAGIADGEEGGLRWALDHLFLDHRGVPTLVEVKRASNPELRRKVVGQLLEYAANAAFTWKPGALRRVVEEEIRRGEGDPGTVLVDRLGVTDPEEFWSAVDDNLRLGRLRLLFVADRIPAELQRVVEFLNEQMDRTEVLAVEVRQFAGEGHKTLVPRVLGRTSAAEGRKATSRPRRFRPWTPEEFLDLLQKLGQERDASIAERVLDWAEGQGLSIAGGTGTKVANLYLTVTQGEKRFRSFYLSGSTPRAALHTWFDEMGESFEPAAPARAELCNRINAIVESGASPEAHYPGVSFALLEDEQTLEAVLRELSWALQVIRGR